MKRIPAILLALTLLLTVPGCEFGGKIEKPVIYLYPERTTEIAVRLDYAGELTCTYPQYDGGWTVTAEPDGTLYSDGREYSYLFWEGSADIEYDFSRGFCVRGEDTLGFLLEVLPALGLTPREYNDFIVYWLPRMQDNAYNLISFQSEAYTDAAALEIEPQPDSLLRVFMAYKPLNAPVEIEPQTFEAFERIGFTVVEWGGTEIR